MELDSNFKIGQPIQQGDLFGFWDWRTRPPLKRFGVIITADCDIQNGDHDQPLVYLRIIAQSDYVDVFWSRAKLAIARSKALQDLVPQINKLRVARDPNSANLSAAEIQFWVTSETPQNIADTIGVDEERESARLIRNIERARKIMDFASAPLGSCCLDRLLQVRNQQRDNVLNQAVNDLNSDRDEIFFLTALTDSDDHSGYYILLDQIGAVGRDQLSDSMDAVSRGLTKAYRFGTLAKTYKYAVAQRFAYLFQKIGLPNDHKERHQRALTRINSAEGDV